MDQSALELCLFLRMSGRFSAFEAQGHRLEAAPALTAAIVHLEHSAVAAKTFGRALLRSKVTPNENMGSYAGRVNFLGLIAGEFSLSELLGRRYLDFAHDGCFFQSALFPSQSAHSLLRPQFDGAARPRVRKEPPGALIDHGSAGLFTSVSAGY
jgi:hypothetical protein